MKTMQKWHQVQDGGMMTFDFSGLPFRRELTGRDLERMRIPQRYWEVQFDRISDDRVPGAGMSSKEMIGNYIRNIPEAWKSGGGLVLWGSNGSGKTAASVVLAKEFRRRGHTVLFQEAAALKRMVIDREHFDEDETYWDRARTVDVLVVDDFGKGIIDSTGFGASIFDELIRARNSRKLVTIITSNLSIQKWSKKVKDGGLELSKSTMGSLIECAYPVHVVGDNSQRRGSYERLKMLTRNIDEMS